MKLREQNFHCIRKVIILKYPPQQTKKPTQPQTVTPPKQKPTHKPTQQQHKSTPKKTTYKCTKPPPQKKTPVN